MSKNSFSATQAGAESGDAAVIRSVLRGDTNAFSALAQRHRRRVFGTCVRITRDRESAEDCVQTSLATALEHLDQFRADAPFSAWLTRIAVNVAISHVRKKGPAGTTEIPIDAMEDGRPVVQVPDPHADPEAVCYRRELHSLLHREIRALPPKFRCVVLLRVFEGLSTADAARALGISPEAVKSRLFRAHQRIKLRLQHAMPGRGVPHDSGGHRRL